MPRAAFSVPVHVLVGLGHLRTISNASEALALLDDIPASSSDLIHATVRENCIAAMRGLRSADVARELLEAYAEARGILIEAPIHKPAPPMRAAA